MPPVAGVDTRTSRSWNRTSWGMVVGFEPPLKNAIVRVDANNYITLTSIGWYKNFQGSQDGLLWFNWFLYLATFVWRPSMAASIRLVFFPFWSAMKFR